MNFGSKTRKKKAVVKTCILHIRG